LRRREEAMRLLKLTIVFIAAAFSVWQVDLYDAGNVQAASVKLPRVSTVDGDKVLTLLPPDGIPAIDDPTFAKADKAGFMKDHEPVVGVVHNGVAKAYSLWHLDTLEIVNDRFGKDPVAVTW
jgi:Protein of unknown function (DUF3179)